MTAVDRGLGASRVPYGELSADDPRQFTLLGVLANVPRIRDPQMALTEAVTADLDDLTAEIVILRVAASLRANYQWSHHLPKGRRAGLSEQDIAAIRSGDTTTMPADRAALVQYVTGVVAGDVPDDVWAAFSATCDTARAVNITMLAANYVMISLIALSLNVPVEPQYAEFADL
jgi:alkylhydroperoxidase family enzyme